MNNIRQSKMGCFFNRSGLTITVLLFFLALSVQQIYAECYYLYPPVLYLTSGVTSSQPLLVKDESGNIVSGTKTFYPEDHSLIQVSSAGYVTALRAEDGDDYMYGVGVRATIDGQDVTNACIIRVLSSNYGIPYEEIVGDNIVLYYPTTIFGEDLSTYVDQYQIPTVLDYAYIIQSSLLDLYPFNGCRQVFEVEYSDNPDTTLCGWAGQKNPLRFGWWLQEGDPWRNCFLVPFIEPRSPQWPRFFHELGHNFTGDSNTFRRGLGNNYSEAMASIIYYATAEIILNSDGFPIENGTRISIQQRYDEDTNNALNNELALWLAQGADFNSYYTGVTCGLWLTYRNSGVDFAKRFFHYLDPQYESALNSVLTDVENQGANGQHTFFAALISAAMCQDLSSVFRDTYHFPIIQTLFNNALSVLNSIKVIEVTKPDGGENWIVNTQKAIKWTSVGICNNVKIELGRPDGCGTSWSTIAASTPNDGEYIWTVQSPAQANCYFRISSLNNSSTSNLFNILDSPHVTVLVPNGGENWGYGEAQTIQWETGTGTGSTVSIQYKVGSSSWQAIVSGTANDGSYTWVPNSSTYCSFDGRIKITSSGGYSDESNSTFAVDCHPTMNLSNPVVNGCDVNQNGGTDPECGSFDTNWCINSSPDASGNGPFKFTWGDGNISCSWFPADHTYNGTGTYNIKVQSKNTCWSGVTERSKNATVSSCTRLAIISPNGGENWGYGEAQTIQWETGTGTGSTVSIQYKVGSSSWQAIVSGTANDGSYTWVPNSSTYCSFDGRIKITSSGGYSDESNSTFAVDCHPTMNLSNPVVNGCDVNQNGGTDPECGSFDTNWCINSSPDASGNGPFKFTWGDGNISCSWFPGTHTYSSPNTYNVSVKVKNSCGYIAERNKYVTVP